MAEPAPAATTDVTVTFSTPLASSSALSHNTNFFMMPDCAQACETVQQAAQLCLWGSGYDESWCFCASALLKPLKSTKPPKLCPGCSDQDWQYAVSNYTDGCEAIGTPPGAATSTVIRTATITSPGATFGATSTTLSASPTHLPLPAVPQQAQGPASITKGLAIGLPIACVLVIVGAIVALCLCLVRRRRRSEKNAQHHTQRRQYTTALARIAGRGGSIFAPSLIPSRSSSRRVRPQRSFVPPVPIVELSGDTAKMPELSHTEVHEKAGSDSQ